MNNKGCNKSNLFVIYNCNHRPESYPHCKVIFLKWDGCKIAILFGHIGHLLGKEQSYIFKNNFIVFLDPENPIIDTRNNVVDTIDVELCAKMYVAANGGQYGRHLENVASYGIQKYSVVFLDPQNPNLDTKIITVAILEVKINVKMCLAAILAAILNKKKNYIFRKYFIVFLDQENPIIDTRISVVNTIDVEL